MKVFIIAGNHQQFKDYMRDKEDTRNYVYVSGVENLRGYNEPHGKLIGTWYNRTDLGGILMQLRLASSIDHDQVMAILEWRNELTGKKKPAFPGMKDEW